MSQAETGLIKVLVIDDSNTIRRSAEIFSRIARAGAIGQDVTAEVGLAL